MVVFKALYVAGKDLLRRNHPVGYGYTYLFVRVQYAACIDRTTGRYIVFL